MVNCAQCQRSFRSSFGKSKSTRCEGCAESWRKLQIFQEELQREKLEREDKLKQSELVLREKQLEMERQKVTIKETLPNGNTIELTCYYDKQAQHKISEVLAGARRALPAPPATPPTRLPFERRRITNVMPSPTDLRRARKLPSVEGMLKNRIAQRHKLDEDGSSGGSASGTSID